MNTRFELMALALAAAITTSQTALAQGGPPPSSLPVPSNSVPADPWPREMTLSSGRALIYQPQVESWSGNALRFRVAVALKRSNAKIETFGVVSGSARTSVDRGARLVDLDDFGVFKANFPTLANNGSAYMDELTWGISTVLSTISLNRLEASLAASATARPAPQPVDNTPPNVIVNYGPALLVPIDGTPVIKGIPNTRYSRVINTQALIARNPSGDGYYLHVYDGWVAADALSGPWRQASAPAGLDGVAQELAQAGRVDLLDGGPNATPQPSLANGVPAIYVTEKPSELVVFKGQPNFIGLPNTNLLWASNTAADVLVDMNTDDYYILIAGRWYRGPAVKGPWTHVPANALPADFARIPKHGPASVVLASVAGTAQAAEALIANSIPQDASVARSNGPTFTPSFDGAPQFKSIAGTPLQYVVNSGTPIIQVSATGYYAVTGGIWFSAPALTGPWGVATSVPALIYTIPTSSPLHYVTYVRVYGYTPSVVYVGYTPGYLGTVVSPDGVVVYGTGYDYTPWIGSEWYPLPVTWGIAAAPVYNPAVGFSFGFAIGLATAAIAEPYWGGAYFYPYYHGYPCCGSVGADVYRSWGRGVSAGTRTWYASSGGTIGSYASGRYATARGTSGSYSAGRSYNPYTGQAQRGYSRTFNTAGGTSGDVTRQQSYNAYTGEHSYSSSASATGKEGSTVDRTTSTAAGPQGVSHSSSTTTYNARTGETRTWTNTSPSNNNVLVGADGKVYRSNGGGWQQYGSNGWTPATGGSVSYADNEQQARNTAQSRESSYGSGAGGWDRSGSGSASWASRYGGQSGGNWADRYAGAQLGGGGWGDRFGGSSFAGRFGGGRGFRR